MLGVDKTITEDEELDNFSSNSCNRSLDLHCKGKLSKKSLLIVGGK